MLIPLAESIPEDLTVSAISWANASSLDKPLSK